MERYGPIVGMGSLPRPVVAVEMDYYLLRAEADHVAAAGLLVEEFVLADDLRSTTRSSPGTCDGSAAASPDAST